MWPVMCTLFQCVKIYVLTGHTKYASTIYWQPNSPFFQLLRLDYLIDVQKKIRWNYQNKKLYFFMATLKYVLTRYLDICFLHYFAFNPK